MEKIFDEISVIEEIKKHQGTDAWVTAARDKAKELRALVDGKNFDELLIQQIEKIESNQRAVARKKYSKDIRDVFHRINNKRENIFQATGGSEEIKTEAEELKAKFIMNLNHFKSGKSISKYLSEYYFRQLDTDPNGVIFLEYKTEPELHVYPTFKSIDAIRHYDADGQKVEYIIFEPKKDLKAQVQKIEWRLVDAKTDWRILQVGDTFIVDTEKTFEHPFGEVPAIIMSDYIELGQKVRLSFINPIVELAKDYARDKSILTIYKFQNGFPKHWQYTAQCRECHGTGKKGTSECKPCAGTGVVQRKDVTDQINVSLPKEGDPVIAPNIAGFIQPDLETWRQYKEDLKDMEAVMEHTIWGTHEVKGSSETATGRFIDVQPITNELNNLSDKVQWVHNTLANWTANAYFPLKKKEEPIYFKAYGKRFIIEGPDSILEKYEKSRSEGANTTILDKLMQEYILSKYKTDPFMQERMIKKATVEPYVHYTIEQVNTIFGKAEAFKKAVFNDFWEEADHSKDAMTLKNEFEVYAKEQMIAQGIIPKADEQDNKLLSTLTSVSPLLANKLTESLTVNEIREIFGREAIEGGDALPDSSQNRQQFQ